jgi:hypothetical protein
VIGKVVVDQHALAVKDVLWDEQVSERCKRVEQQEKRRISGRDGDEGCNLSAGGIRRMGPPQLLPSLKG